MILPTAEIKDLFKDVYPRQEDAWLYPSYRLGIKTVLTRGTFHVEVPLRDPETVTAFNNGCLDGLELLQGRKELERAVVATSTKNPNYKYSPVSNLGNKEYNPGF
jgi:hypothetical protein